MKGKGDINPEQPCNEPYQHRQQDCDDRPSSHTLKEWPTAFNLLLNRIVPVVLRVKHSLEFPILANHKVSHRSQPPMTFDLSLSQLAGSGWLHRLGLGRTATDSFEPLENHFK
ncbi:MAG TPA: hypothetical protein VJA21_26695 [Verrucomicrobiae bacterium]